MITDSQRADAIRSANFVKDSIIKSLRDAPYDSCPEEVIENLKHQLTLFKALQFIRDYKVSYSECEVKFTIITNVGEEH